MIARSIIIARNYRQRSFKTFVAVPRLWGFLWYIVKVSKSIFFPRQIWAAASINISLILDNDHLTVLLLNKSNILLSFQSKNLVTWNIEQNFFLCFVFKFGLSYIKYFHLFTRIFISNSRLETYPSPRLRSRSHPYQISKICL